MTYHIYKYGNVIITPGNWVIFFTVSVTLIIIRNGCKFYAVGLFRQNDAPKTNNVLQIPQYRWHRINDAGPQIVHRASRKNTRDMLNLFPGRQVWCTGTIVSVMHFGVAASYIFEIGKSGLYLKLHLTNFKHRVRILSK